MVAEAEAELRSAAERWVLLEPSRLSRYWWRRLLVQAQGSSLAWLPEVAW